MMPRFVYFIFLALFSFFFIACGNEVCSSEIDSSNKDIIKVSVSIPPVAYFVEQIALDDVVVCSMISSQQIPELAEPSFAKKSFLNQSSLYFKLGIPGLLFEDRFLDKLHKSNSKMTLVDLSHSINLAKKQKYPNPHIWISLRHVPLFTKTIVDHLTRLRPNKRQFYLANRQALLKKMNIVHQQWQQSLADDTMLIITSHPILHYLATEYNFHNLSLEHQSKPITLTHFQAVRDTIKNYSKIVLVVDKGHSSKLAQLLSQRFSIPMIYWSPMEKDVLSNLGKLRLSIQNSFKEKNLKDEVKLK